MNATFNHEKPARKAFKMVVKTNQNWHTSKPAESYHMHPSVTSCTRETGCFLWLVCKWHPSADESLCVSDENNEIRQKIHEHGTADAHHQKVDTAHAPQHSQNQVSMDIDLGPPSIQSTIVNGKPSPGFQQMDSKAQRCTFA
jgi:hypothetical protein